METTLMCKLRRLHVMVASVLLCLLPVLGAADNIEASGSSSVHVCGFHVVGQCFSDATGKSRNAILGTTISLIVEHTGERLLKFDAEASSITEFSDDAGKNLLNRQDYGSLHRLFGHPSSQTISRDGKSAAIDVTSLETPTKGSREVSLKGTLVFQAASKMKTVSSEHFSLEPGSAVTAGHIRVKVKDMTTHRFGDPHLASLQTRQLYVKLVTEGQHPDSLVSVKLNDGMGKTISERRGVGIHSKNGRVTGVFTFVVPDGTTEGTLELTYWSNMKPVEMPFALTVAAGL